MRRSWPLALMRSAGTGPSQKHVLADQIESRGAAPGGLTWYYARPPVEGLDYEMDVRSIPVQRIV